MNRLQFLAVFACLALSACTDPRTATRDKLREIGVQRLRFDAALLYKQLFAGPTVEFITLKPDQCPTSFRELSPMQVGAAREGFTLALRGKTGIESGLHISPAGMTSKPHATHATYEQIEDGIWWYTIAK